MRARPSKPSSIPGFPDRLPAEANHHSQQDQDDVHHHAEHVHLLTMAAQSEDEKRLGLVSVILIRNSGLHRSPTRSNDHQRPRRQEFRIKGCDDTHDRHQQGRMS